MHASLANGIHRFVITNLFMVSINPSIYYLKQNRIFVTLILYLSFNNIHTSYNYILLYIYIILFYIFTLLY